MDENLGWLRARSSQLAASRQQRYPFWCLQDAMMPDDTEALYADSFITKDCVVNENGAIMTQQLPYPIIAFPQNLTFQISGTQSQPLISLPLFPDPFHSRLPR